MLQLLHTLLWNYSFCQHNSSIHAVQNKSSEYCAPVTSFDWNETDIDILGTLSIDTICTIWELQVKWSLYTVYQIVLICINGCSTSCVLFFEYNACLALDHMLL